VVKSVCGLAGPAGTCSRVWSPARGRAGVVSRRVILLRCLRIRGPTGPANLCTGGRLPSNGGIYIRSQGGAAGGHVTRSLRRGVHNSMHVYLLLAASATKARRAGRLPARARTSQRWPAAVGASVPNTVGRCCAGRGAVCCAARTRRVDAGTQLIYSEFIRETCTYFTMQTRQATYMHAYSYPGVHAPSHYTLTYR